jgi:hypothetical protein
VTEPSQLLADAKERRAWARAQRAASVAHYEAARRRALVAMRLTWRVRTKVYDRFGPVTAMARPVPASPAPEDDLVGRARSAYFTMLSCEALVDTETAATLRAAMSSLADVMRYGRLASGDLQLGLLDQMCEIEVMVDGIHAHLLRTERG